jgi:hypothetical protein
LYPKEPEKRKAIEQKIFLMTDLLDEGQLTRDGYDMAGQDYNIGDKVFDVGGNKRNLNVIVKDYMIGNSLYPMIESIIQGSGEAAASSSKGLPGAVAAWEKLGITDVTEIGFWEGQLSWLYMIGGGVLLSFFGLMPQAPPTSLNDFSAVLNLSPSLFSLVFSLSWLSSSITWAACVCRTERKSAAGRVMHGGNG